MAEGNSDSETNESDSGYQNKEGDSGISSSSVSLGEEGDEIEE